MFRRIFLCKGNFSNNGITASWAHKVEAVEISLERKKMTQCKRILLEWNHAGQGERHCYLWERGRGHEWNAKGGVGLGEGCGGLVGVNGALLLVWPFQLQFLDYDMFYSVSVHFFVCSNHTHKVLRKYLKLEIGKNLTIEVSSFPLFLLSFLFFFFSSFPVFPKSHWIQNLNSPAVASCMLWLWACITELDLEWFLTSF